MLHNLNKRIFKFSKLNKAIYHFIDCEFLQMWSVNIF